MIMYPMDIPATSISAVSGGFCTVNHELDLLGVLVLSTGAGGGVIRDIVFRVTPPMSIGDERHLLACIAAGLMVFLVAPRIASGRKRSFGSQG